jgi:hypothetical protein
MVRRSTLISAVLALLVMTVGAATAAPQLINYQGILTDNNGNPITDRHNLTFKIYRDSTDNIVLWSESHNNLQITNGLVNVVLGYTTDIPLSLFGTANRWLGITVDSDTEMAPRTRFTSSPWSFRAAVADSALKAPGGGGAWTISGDNVHSALPGNVGIGNTDPPKKLSIGDISVLGSEGMLRLQSRSPSSGSNRTWDVGIPNTASSGSGFSFCIDDLNAGTEPEFMVKWNSGRVGIGTISPERKLHVNCANVEDGIRIGWGSDYPSVFGDITHALNGGLVFNSDAGGGSWADMQWRTNNVTRMYLTSQGNLGIGTTAPTALLEVAGTAKVQILQITGADVAEKFQVRGKAEPGTVVAIDPDHAGELCIARGEYNRRVAGVISGAGDLPVGAVLGNLPGQEKALPLALTGRVWVQCDASGGAIEPGDLLTTSNTPGVAMKATDPLRSPGATIGKAMTSLREGRGLVLTLVGLQ